LNTYYDVSPTQQLFTSNIWGKFNIGGALLAIMGTSKALNSLIIVNLSMYSLNDVD
jgi:hypothetical protein